MLSQTLSTALSYTAYEAALMCARDVNLQESNSLQAADDLHRVLLGIESVAAATGQVPKGVGPEEGESDLASLLEELRSRRTRGERLRKDQASMGS